MAKKLTRKTLDELAETMTILSKDEQMEVIGGKVVIIDKTGKIKYYNRSYYGLYYFGLQ